MSRSRSCGTESESFMTATAAWSTPRRRSRASFAWTQVRRPWPFVFWRSPGADASADFEKANEIFFRLGIIYKQQRKSQQSLEVSSRPCLLPLRNASLTPCFKLPQCFRYILQNPPRPLTEIDIWFQIGHVYEQQKDVRRTLPDRLRQLVADPLLSHCSLSPPRSPTTAFSPRTRPTRRCCSSSAASTTAPTRRSTTPRSLFRS